MEKKHLSGFVPIPFKLAGKVMLPISIVMMAIWGLDYIMGWDSIPFVILFMGLGFFIISLYLLFIVPKE